MLLATALAEVQAMLGAMFRHLSAAATEPASVYRIGQHSVRLLLAVGDLLVGWLLVRQADVALTALDGPVRARDEGFYLGKVGAARFFAGTVLPRLSADRAIIEAADNALMDLPESPPHRRAVENSFSTRVSGSAGDVVLELFAFGLELVDPRLDQVADADDPDQLPVDEHREVPEPPGGHNLGQVGTLSAGVQVVTPDVMNSAIARLSTSGPCVCSCRTTSRSETMPTNRPSSSTTGSAPTLYLASSPIRSASVAVGLTVATELPLLRSMSAIRMYDPDPSPLMGREYEPDRGHERVVEPYRANQSSSSHSTIGDGLYFTVRVSRRT